MDNILDNIPDSHKKPLLLEFKNLRVNYYQHKWLPTEIHAGRFCEIVYSIISGYAIGTYPQNPQKPSDFVAACRTLENQSVLPRSFRILIPRWLLPLYEIRNNRDVGHVGGDVSSNYMDSTTVVCVATWILAELVRVFHGVSVAEAQKFVDSLVQYPVPWIWESVGKRRVLIPDISLKDQILILLSSKPGKISVDTLNKDVECKTKKYLYKILQDLHKKRWVEFDSQKNDVEILPPGAKYVSSLNFKNFNPSTPTF